MFSIDHFCSDLLIETYTNCLLLLTYCAESPHCILRSVVRSFRILPFVSPIIQFIKLAIWKPKSSLLFQKKIFTRMDKIASTLFRRTILKISLLILIVSNYRFEIPFSYSLNHVPLNSYSIGYLFVKYINDCQNCNSFSIVFYLI